MRSPRQQKINPIYNNTEQPEQNQTNLNLLRTHKSSFISKVEIRVGLNLVWRFKVGDFWFEILTDHLLFLRSDDLIRLSKQNGDYLIKQPFCSDDFIRSYEIIRS